MKYWDILNGISKYLPKFGFVSFEGLWNSLKITSKMRYCQIMETLIPQPVWLLFRQHCTDTKQGMIPWWKPRSPSIFSCHGFHWKIKLSSLFYFVINLGILYVTLFMLVNMTQWYSVEVALRQPFINSFMHSIWRGHQ